MCWNLTSNLVNRVEGQCDHAQEVGPVTLKLNFQYSTPDTLTYYANGFEIEPDKRARF